MVNPFEQTSTYWKGLCNFFWGSHGCDLPRDHTEVVHRCFDGETVCSEYDEARPTDARVRWVQEDNNWGSWQPYREGWRQ